MAKPTLQVPAIDIAPFLSGDPEGKRAVVDAVRSACRDIGFLVIAGHGLSTDDLARAFTLTRNFFDLPQETKNKWHPTGPSKQRGYHAFETRGLAHTMDANVPLDLRETVFLGPIDDQRAHYEALA